MPENWKTYKLGDIADVQNGYAFKSKDLGENGIPVIKIKNIIPPNVVLEGAGYFTGELNSKLEKYILKKNDFLISMTGSTVNVMSSAVGKMGRYRLDDIALLNQRAGKIYITDQEKADFDYLCHFLSRYEIHYNLALNATGSANQANISPAQIKDIKVLLPPLEEQKSIASILSALDDKIELNLQMNKTLEEMAMALYKHWFVDFEPFQDGEFVDSELGEIPKGWEVQSINDFGKVVCGKTPSKKDPDNFTQIGGYPFIKIPEMHGNVFLTETVERVSEKGNQTQAKKLLPSGCITVSCIATVGLVTINALPSHTNQQINSIIPEKTIYRYYLYSTMISLKERFLNEASGGSATLNMNTSTFSNIEILKPDEETLQKFSEMTNSVYSKILLNQEENQTLTQLRDTLLPKLISGEVRVKDAEKTLSEVL